LPYANEVSMRRAALRLRYGRSALKSVQWTDLPLTRTRLTPLDLLVRRDRARRNAPHPGKWVKIIRWGDAAEAKALIIEGVTRARGAKK